jgi:protein-disulfide isomerase
MAELEQLSRYAAGELPASEAHALEAELARRPALRRALQRLAALDDLVASMPAPARVPSDDVQVRRAVERAHAPRKLHVFRWAWLPVAAAAAAVFFWVREPAPNAEQVARRGDDGARARGSTASANGAHANGAHANGAQATLGADRPAASGPSTESAPVRIVALPEGQAVLTSSARVSATKSELFLHAGTLLAQGDGVRIRAGEDRIVVRGAAFVSMEPAQVMSRVTEVQDLTSLGGIDMQQSVKSWRAALSTKPLASAALVLLVAQGNALAQDPTGARHAVRAGQTWSPTKVASAAQALQREEPGTPQRLCNAEGPGNIDLTKVDEVMPSVSGLGECFAQGLKADPKLQGKVTLLLTVAARGGKGYVREAAVAEDYSLNNPFVMSCLLERFAQAEFPAPTDGKDAQLKIPLELIPRGEAQPGLPPGVMVKMPTRQCAFTAGGKVESKRVVGTVMTDRTERIEVNLGDSPSTGPARAPITWVEFTDFECPFCIRNHKALEALKKEYGDRVRFVFKQNPLPMHKNARLAAAAALAANEQGKYWEYREKLFTPGGALDRSALERYASDVGLDVSRFRAALDSKKFDATIDADLAEGKRVGVMGIPFSVINGREVNGARSVDAYRKLLEEELAARR